MPVNKSVPRPVSPPVKEKSSMKVGIVTVLRSDPEKTNSAAASIRRTLSADMSSKNWLKQNGLKKIASFKELAVNRPDPSPESNEDNQNRPGHDDIWKSIQQEKEKNLNQKSNIWSALVQKSELSKSDLPPPYVHPLVKRSTSSLSEKSLEICTESLGSETGSDRFPSYPGSEFSDEDKEERHMTFPQEEKIKGSDSFEDLDVVKYKVSPTRPFPPPITSIAGADGASLHMHSKRMNGRLVLEAVSVPSVNYFQAQRQDGRLVLTLVNSPNEEVEENDRGVFDNMEEVDDIHVAEENLDVMHNNHRDDFGYSEDEEEDEEEEEEITRNNVVKEMEYVPSTKSRMINVHKTGLVMKKIVAQGNKSPTWSKKMINMIAEDEGLIAPQSLPPLAYLFPPPAPPADEAGSFNAYDYFWRKNIVINPMIGAPTYSSHKNQYNNKMNQEMVIIKEKFAPYVRDCKNWGRSLLVSEPYCIATS